MKTPIAQSDLPLTASCTTSHNSNTDPVRFAAVVCSDANCRYPSCGVQGVRTEAVCARTPQCIIINLIGGHSLSRQHSLAKFFTFFFVVTGVQVGGAVDRATPCRHQPDGESPKADNPLLVEPPDRRRKLLGSRKKCRTLKQASQCVPELQGDSEAIFFLCQKPAVGTRGSSQDLQVATRRDDGWEATMQISQPVH